MRQSNTKTTKHIVATFEEEAVGLIDFAPIIAEYIDIEQFERINVQYRRKLLYETICHINNQTHWTLPQPSCN